TEDAGHLAAAGRIPAESADELEATLTGYAAAEPPDFLRRIGTRAVTLLDPDGQQPTEGELLAKQGIFFRQPRRGMVHVDGHLSVAQYETLMSAIGWATNPNNHKDINTIDPLTTGSGTEGAGAGAEGAGSGTRVQDFISGVTAAFGAGQEPQATSWPPAQGPLPGWASTADPDGESDAGGAGGGPKPWPHLINGISVPEPGSEQDLAGLDPIDPNSTDPAVVDRRTHGQKLLDGLIDCLKLAARTGTLPLNGGLKPQLFISTTEADLERSTTTGRGGGIAFLPYSGPQPLELFTVELCDADVTTMVLGDGCDILNVGRTQRLFTATQRKILLARDLGCTFPDCTAVASWCDAHHIIPWHDGGETSINNGVLLCSMHHQLLHRGHWSVSLEQGIPWYTPSYSIDPTQRPRRNFYHHGTARN
ncbi:HNH endonuclease signature motif containing protein, partial [Arthrobacter sp. TMN-49]